MNVVKNYYEVPINKLWSRSNKVESEILLMKVLMKYEDSHNIVKKNVKLRRQRSWGNSQQNVNGINPNKHDNFWKYIIKLLYDKIVRPPL